MRGKTHMGGPRPTFDDPSLHAVYCAAKFKPSPLFPDRRGALAKALMGLLDTDEWRFDGGSLDVSAEEGRRMVGIELGSFYFIAEEPGTTDATLAELEQALAVVSEMLELTEFSSVAVNLEWLVGIAAPQGVQKWFRERLGLTAANTLLDPFGGGPTDTKCEFTFEVNSDEEEPVSGFQLSLSGVTASEMAGDTFFEAEESSFPDEAVKVEIWNLDTALLGSVDEAGAAFRAAYERAWEAGDRVTAELHGEV